MSNLGKATMTVEVNVQGIKRLAAVHQALTQISGVLRATSGNITIGGRMPGGPGGGRGDRGPGAGAGGGKYKIGGPLSALTQDIIDLRSASFALRDAGRQFAFFTRYIIQGFQPIIQVGGDFQQSVKNVQSVISELQSDTPMTTLQVNGLAQAFLRLAETTEFTAVEVAGAAKTLALAGFTVNEVKNSLRGVLDLATAGSLETQEAAQIVANVMRAYQIEAQHSTRIADVLAQAQSNSNATVKDLGESFKMVSGTASTLGISIEQTAGALSLLANTGSRGTLAGTSLNRMFIQLRDESEKFDKVMRRFGSSFDAIDLRKRTLVEVFQEFKRVTSSSREAAFAIASAFDMRAARAFLALLGQGADELSRITGLMDDAAGTAERIREIRLDTLQGDLLLLKSAWETLLVEVFNVIEPELQRLVQQLRKFILATIEWVRVNKGFVEGLFEVVANVVVATTVFGTFLTVLGSVIGIIAGLKYLAVAFLPVLGKALLAIPGIILKWVASLSALIPVLYASLGPIGFILAAVGAIAAVIFGVVKAFDSWRDSQLSLAEAEAAALAINVKYRKSLADTGTQIKQYSRELSGLQKAFEVFQKGGLAAPTEIKQLQETGLFDAAFGKFSLSKVDADLRRLEEFRELLVARQVDVTLDKMQHDANRPWWRGDAQRIHDVQAEALQKNVDLAAAQLKKINEIAEASRRTRNSIKDLWEVLNRGPQGVRDAVANTRDEIIRLEQEIERRTTSDVNFTQKELEAYEKQISILKDKEQWLKSINDLTAEAYEGLLVNGEIDAKLLTERLTSLSEYMHKLQVVQQRNEEIRKNAQEELDLDKQLRDLKETHYQREIREIEEVIQATREKIESLMEEETLLRSREKDQLKIEAHLIEEARLRGELVKLTEIHSLKIAEINEEMISRQDEILNNLRLEQAERQGNFEEYERLIREIRGKEIDQTIRTTFEGASSDVIDEFRNLKEAELESFLEAERKKFEQARKSNKERSREAEIQDRILDNLVQQVKTLEGAARVTLFLRGIERIREREARQAAYAALSARRRAEAAEAALVGASPEDIGRLRAIAEKERTLSNLSTSIFKKRTATAGLSDADLSASFANSISPIPSIADNVGEAMFNNLTDWLSKTTEAFQNAPQKWAASLGSLLTASPAVAALNLGTAAVGNTFTFNITNMTDANNFMKMLDSFAKTHGFRK